MMKGETVLSGAPHPGTKMEIMESGAGYYLGFRTKKGEPYTRETHYMQSWTLAWNRLSTFRDQ